MSNCNCYTHIGPVALISTGFQTKLYHRYDSCNYVTFGSQMINCIIDTTHVIMLGFGFQMILYHRYDTCN